MVRAKKERAIIGWREWVGLPELGVDRIKVKIDTGARTSAIHAFGIKPLERDGQKFVSFSLHPVQHHRNPVVDCEARVVDERTITSSNGEQEHRYVIVTNVELGNAIWPIELTLTNRDEMGFRMLLGRAALRRRFIVDPGSSFKHPDGRLAQKSKSKQPKLKKPKLKKSKRKRPKLVKPPAEMKTKARQT